MRKSGQAVGIELDPFLETADTELEDNYWPRKSIPSKFDVFKQRSR
ncbi:MAG: hypothetical protein WDZ35_02165 [Crocinitomicaceae bacterium]